MDHHDVLIVGSGHGGAQAAIALRQNGFAGSIGLLGKEPELPYERPALSKDYLAGEKGFDRILIRPASFWKERTVDLLSGRRVVAVNAAAHNVTLRDGETHGYGKLIWAAGGEPRRIGCDGHDLTGVHAIRTRADVDRLRGELDHVTHVVVIGGGYVGLEAAAVLVKAGKRVVLLEALDRVLARVAGEPLSRFYEAEHRARGVDVRLDVTVQGIEGEGRVSGVRLAGGELIPAEMVIVGIGIIPAVQPLIAAGADGGNGVAVDTQCRTSLADVFAIGDCARHINPYGNDTPVRVESVQNANDQAMVAAKAMLGHDIRYDAVPWFWSNQYDLRLQTVGLSIGHDAAIIRGDPATRSFSVVYTRRGQVIALDCVNATKDYVQGRRLVVDRLSPDPASLCDTGQPLKEMVG